MKWSKSAVARVSPYMFCGLYGIPRYFFSFLKLALFGLNLTPKLKSYKSIPINLQTKLQLG